MKKLDNLDDIRDDQIRIIGGNVLKPRQQWFKRPAIIATLAIVIIALLILSWWQYNKAVEDKLREPEPALFEPELDTNNILIDTLVQSQPISERLDSIATGYTEIRDTLINDIQLKLYIPHDAELTLQLDPINKQDTSIVFVAQAADVRADNGDIVGAFVLKGEPLSWGLSKKGYCASINGKIYIGYAESTPLFETATEQGGYFFRQYPLVSNGKLIENKPKGKAIRRAICDRNGEVFIVESHARESFHDFAQALVDLGVNQAIYIVGSSAYGWAIDENRERHEFGIEEIDERLENGIKPKINYMVWRKNSK